MNLLRKGLSILLSASMAISLVGPLPALAASPKHPSALTDLTVDTSNTPDRESDTRNLVLDRPTTASSTANDCGPELAVDGDTKSAQWNSEDMKTGVVPDETEQPPNG